MITALVTLAIYLVILVLVIGLLLYIVRTAPWGDPSIKQMISWALIVIGCLIAVLLLLQFVGVIDPPYRALSPR